MRTTKRKQLSQSESIVQGSNFIKLSGVRCCHSQVSASTVGQVTEFCMRANTLFGATLTICMSAETREARLYANYLFFVVASNALIPSLRTRGQGGLGSFMKYGFLGSYPEKVTTFVKVSLPHRCHTGSLLLGHRVLDVRLGVCRPALVYPCSLVFCFSSIS